MRHRIGAQRHAMLTKIWDDYLQAKGDRIMTFLSLYVLASVVFTIPFLLRYAVVTKREHQSSEYHSPLGM
jgi:hypothetical protein